MRLQKMFLLGCAVLALGACESAVDGAPLQPISFVNMQTSSLAVADYQVNENYALSVQDPQNQYFLTPTGPVIADYLRHRFFASGGQGSMVASIEEASVTHQLKPSEGAVRSFLNVDKADDYIVKVVVRLVVQGTPHFLKKEHVVTAQRHISISEHVSLAEREKIQHDSLQKLIAELDGAVMQAVSNEFHVLQ